MNHPLAHHSCNITQLPRDQIGHHVRGRVEYNATCSFLVVVVVVMVEIVEVIKKATLKLVSSAVSNEDDRKRKCI